MYIDYGYGRYGNMNIMYLSLYGVAAVVLAVVFIRTCLERDKMTRIVCLTEMLALICVVTYSVNFITDNYMAMSVATSIMTRLVKAGTPRTLPPEVHIAGRLCGCRLRTIF